MLYSSLALIIFVIAYFFVLLEEIIKLRKSKPVVVAAGLIWICVALAFREHPPARIIEEFRNCFFDFAQLFFFILVSMAYVNALSDRGAFSYILKIFQNRTVSMRQFYWMVGITSFFLSAIVDNLASALIMGMLTATVAREDKLFFGLCCIQIVVAANAGGVFSPFGDVTTLMVWQKDKVDFIGFFFLFLPAVVNFLIPSLLIQQKIPKDKPLSMAVTTEVKTGALGISILFIMSLFLAVICQHFLNLPATVGMMLGLGFLKIFSYWQEQKRETLDDASRFNLFQQLERLEWDTLLFFYGIILSIGGLSALGYLQQCTEWLYQPHFFFTPDQQAKLAATLIGMLSAIVDNVPLLYGVLTSSPDLSQGHWLLLTLCAGAGGSLLSIGSAAGIALLGMRQSGYNFRLHLKWSWAIFLGYLASIVCHCWLNRSLF